jgi:fucose permease
MGLLYGVWHSMAVAMIVPLVCYAVVTHYAYYGCRMRTSHAEAAAVS